MAVNKGSDIVTRFTSRKFLAAATAFVVAVLISAGVLEATAEQTFIVQGTPLVYILVQGILDFVKR